MSRPLTKKEIAELVKTQIGWTERVFILLGALLALTVTATFVGIVIKVLLSVWGWIL